MRGPKAPTTSQFTHIFILSTTLPVATFSHVSSVVDLPSSFKFKSPARTHIPKPACSGYTTICSVHIFVQPSVLWSSTQQIYPNALRYNIVTYAHRIQHIIQLMLSCSSSFPLIPGSSESLYYTGSFNINTL